MADFTIKGSFIIDDKGTTKKVAQGAEGASKAYDKFSKKSEEVYRNNQGVAQNTSNTTKAFSKQRQGIQGFLVPAYAELAANLFAASAAFGALQKAAQVEQLTQGLAAMGAQSGIAMQTLSQGLREVTGFAISTEEAMRSTAQVISAGFGGEELNRIGKVARDASIALGRDLQDSMQRLTRGVIKLEPELLDELGIMVRLDEATQRYKETMGIVGRELTLTEKRQAFLNATLEEGENKFAAVSEVDPNPYAKLSASLADLAQTILGIINTAVVPFIEIFSELPILITSVAGVLVSNIVGKMVPGFKKMAEASEEAAGRVGDELAERFSEAVVKLDETSTSLMKLDKSFSAPETRKFFGMIEDGFQGTQEESDQLKAALKSVRIQVTGLEKSSKSLTEQEKVKLSVLRQEKALLEELQGVHTATGETNYKITARQVEAYTAKEKLFRQEATAIRNIEAANTGLLGPLNGLKVGIKEAAKITKTQFVTSVNLAKTSTNAFAVRLTTLNIIVGGFSGAVKGAIRSVKLFGIALLQALPLIGQIIAVGTLAYDFLKDFFVSEEDQKRTEDIKAINEALDENYRILKRNNEQEISSNKDVARFYEARANNIKAIAEQLTNLSQVGADPEDQIAPLKELLEIEPQFRKAFREAFGTRNAEAFIRSGKDLSEVVALLEKEALAGAESISSLSQAARNSNEVFERFFKTLQKRTPFDDIISSTQGYLEILKQTENTEDFINSIRAMEAQMSPTQRAALGLTRTLELFNEEMSDENARRVLERLRASLQEFTGLRERSLRSQTLLDGLKQESNLLNDLLSLEGARNRILQNQSDEHQHRLKLIDDELEIKAKALVNDKNNTTLIEEYSNLALERNQLLTEQAIQKEELVYKIAQAEIRAEQEILSISQRISDEREKQLDLQRQIARDSMILENLRDPNRADGTLTAEQELKLFEEQKQARIEAAVQQFELQKQGIDLEFKLLDAKFLFLEKQAEILNKSLAPEDQIDTGALSQARAALETARGAALDSAQQALLAKVLGIVREGEETRVRATRVIPNLSQPAQLAQARADMGSTRAQGFTGLFQEEAQRQNAVLQQRAQVLETEAQIRQKIIDLSNAGSEQDRYNITNEISLLGLKKQEQQEILEQAKTNASDIGRLGLTIGESLQTNLVSAFQSVLDGTESVKNAFGKMAISVLQDIQAMIVKMLVLKALKAAFQGPLAGVGSFLGFGEGAKEGGIMTPQGKVPGYAVGGIAKGPTQGYPAILHGTEAVVPLPNGKSIPVEPRGSMATNNVEINVNVDNQGNAQTQTQMDDQQAGNLGRAISAAVQEELQRQKRPGGILSPFGAA